VQSSLADFLAVVDGQVTMKSKSLSTTGKLDMTFDEWHQAWQWLLKLIDQYHPDELTLWQMHYMLIMVKETQGEDWPLWLAYDIEVHRHSVTSSSTLLNSRRGYLMTSMCITPGRKFSPKSSPLQG
jgi:hypothetical protein